MVNLKNLSFDNEKIENNLEIEEVSFNDIAIIGMAGAFAGAESLEQYWECTARGDDLITEISERRKKDIDEYYRYLNAEGDYTIRKTGFLKEIDTFDFPFFDFPKLEALTIDPAQRKFLETTWNAIEDAGYGGKKIAGSNTGVYVGYGVDSGYKELLQNTIPSISVLAIPGVLRSMIPSRVSYLLDLKGPSLVIDTACSSTMVALYYACQDLRGGKCDMAILGTVKYNLFPFDNEDAKSNIESIDGKTRSFDAQADGFGIGEGAATVILKPLANALEDKDNIHAVIKGIAINQDGSSIGITAPSPSAQEDVLVKAWEDARIDPRHISYIEAHGTGTNLGDPIEVEGMTRAFNRYTDLKQFCGISSVKTNIGHLDHASGIAGLIKAVLSLKKKKLTPNINYSLFNPKIPFQKSPVYVVDQLEDWEVTDMKRICGVSSIGLSGTNCHAVLEENREETFDEAEEENRMFLFVISAKSAFSLEALINSFAAFLENDSALSLSRMCYTLQTGRWHYEYKIAVPCGTIEELKEKITLLKQQGPFGSTEKGIYYSKANESRENSAPSVPADELVKQFLESGKKSPGLANSLASYYVQMEDLDWTGLYPVPEHIVSLPVYCFEPLRCWPDIPDVPLDRVITSGAKRTADTTGTVEERVIAAWKNVLSKDTASLEDNFFAQGGNSLLSIKLEVELRKRGIKLSYLDVAKYSSLGQLIQAAKGELTDDDINPAEKNKIEQGKTDDIHMESGENDQIIDNIEPYNDVFYKDCFYNSAFPIVKHFNKDILIYLVNDIIAFEGTKSAHMPLAAEYFPVKSLEDVMKEEGIQCKTQAVCQDLEAEVKAAIDMKHPVIVWIDCFYKEDRTDTYKKVHWPHSLLIYGYNEERQVFFIVEHEFRDNLSYKKKVISYANLEEAYQGYLENYHNDKSVPTFSSYSLDESITAITDRAAAFAIFVQNQKNSKEAVYGGLERLKTFCSYFKNLILDKEKLARGVEEVVNGLNTIINIKRVEEYKLTLIAQNDFEGIKSLQESITLWSSLRSIMAKYLFSSVYKEKSMQKAVKAIDEIYTLESVYTDSLYKWIEK